MGWGSRAGARRGVAVLGTAALLAAGSAATLVVPASAYGIVARAADASGGQATLSGRLVAPPAAGGVGGITVTLTATPASGDAVTRTSVTKADGTFRFDNLAGGDWSYVVTAPFQGAIFSSDPVTVPAGQALSIKLPVFTSTSAPDKVKLSSWIVWIDVTGDKVAVEQDVSFTNSGNAAYVGTIPVSGAGTGAKAAVLLPIAPGAGSFQYLGRFEVCCSAVESGSWAHTRPIDPGGSSGTLRYEAVRPQSIAFKAQFPADGMTFLVPQGTTVSSPQLSKSGTTTDKSTTYDVYKSAAVKAGDSVILSFTAPSSTSSATPMWFAALGVVALVGILVIVLLLLRRRRSAATVAPAKADAAAPKAAKARATAAKPAKQKPAVPKVTDAATPSPSPAAATTATATAERSRAEVLAEELAQLDLKFESGELTDEAAYRRVRESLVQRLVDAVAQDPTSLT